MNQLIHNRIGKKKKQPKRGCLFLLAGSLAALLGTGLFILIVSRLTGRVIEGRHGAEAAYALMTAIKPCYGAALLLFYGILAVWYVAPVSSKKGEKPGKAKLSPLLGQKESATVSRRFLWLVTAGLLACVILTGAIAVNTYRLVTPEGIRTYCFTETSSYKWKQVSAYTIDCDGDKGLSVTFTMRDGTQFEILQGVNSATAAFKDTYTSVTHYASEIDSEMVALQVPRNVRHMETAVRFYREDHKELWPYVSRIIGYTDLMPEEDETAPVTEAVTEVASSEMS